MRILTLNTWTQGGPWEKRWDIIFEGIERLSPDLIGFQEVFDPIWAQSVVKRSGYPHAVLGPAESGLMMLSKHPVMEEERLLMPTQSPTEGYPRYIVFAKFRVGQHELASFVTHFSWKLEEGHVREGQSVDFLTFVREKAGTSETVAMGDFNAPPHTPEMKILAEQGGFTDTYFKLHPQDAGLTWDNRNIYASGHTEIYPDRRLDYIFVRNAKHLLKSLKSAEIVFSEPDDNGILASDHYGLLADF